MDMRAKYESLKVADLRDIALHRGIDAKKLKKAEIIEAMIKLDEEESTKDTASTNNDIVNEAPNEDNKQNDAKDGIYVETGRRELDEKVRGRDDGYRPEPRKYGTYTMSPEEKKRDEYIKSRLTAEVNELDSGNACCGILEVLQEGYGFVRSDNFLPGEVDVYVAPSMIRRFRLKTGDRIIGKIRVANQGEKFSALLYLITVNGFDPAKCMRRPSFEDLTPVFPDSRIHLEYVGCSKAMRVVDLVAPIGKGQRGMIVAPPKAGKTTLLKQVAQSVLKNNSEMHLMILLIDERPEEVTDIKESIVGENVEVIYSTFDELPEHHKRVAEMVLERAKRLVEHGTDVMILLDSITRLTRAYNLTVTASGRTLTGGLDPAALHMPKKFFGAARNMREGGSLTVLATALVDTGSKMDDVVYEEFKGTGNMELVLDRKLSERRIFPAIDIVKSGTRREDLLLSEKELQAMEIIRRGLNGSKSETVVESVLRIFAGTRNNDEVINDVIRKRIL